MSGSIGNVLFRIMMIKFRSKSLIMFIIIINIIMIMMINKSLSRILGFRIIVINNLFIVIYILTICISFIYNITFIISHIINIINITIIIINLTIIIITNIINIKLFLFYYLISFIHSYLSHCLLYY
jgi:hypothetical protein